MTGFPENLNATDDSDFLVVNQSPTTLDARNGDDGVLVEVHNPDATINISGGAGEDTIIGTIEAALVDGVQGGMVTLSGGEDDDYINISLDVSDALIDGGEGDDTIAVNYWSDARETYGYTDQRLEITTGDGRDVVKILGANGTVDNPTIVTDFTPGVGGDILDLNELYQYLVGYVAGTNPFSLPSLEFVDTPAGAVLRADAGAGMVTILTLLNVQVADLVAYNIMSGDDPDGTPSSNDTIFGTPGDDVLDGGAGDDRLNAYEGNDLISGGPGNDTIDGGPGADSIDAGPGDDEVWGGTGLGADMITGNDGNDWIRGSENNDTIEGGAGDDEISGAGGDDILYDDAGNNTIEGGTGDDYIEVVGSDYVTDFIEFIANGYTPPANVFNEVDGDAGNDTIVAYGGGLFQGDIGDDSISVHDFFEGAILGDEGNDIIAFEANTTEFTVIPEGAQTAIDGGAGNDTITGSASDLRAYIPDFGFLSNEQGPISISGGADDDLIDVHMDVAEATIDGGTGNDVILLNTATPENSVPIEDNQLVVLTGEGQDTIRLTGWDTEDDNPTLLADFTAGVGGDVLDLDVLVTAMGGASGSDPFATGDVYFVQFMTDTVLVANFSPIPTILLTIPGLDASTLTADNIAGGFTPTVAPINIIMGEDSLGELLEGTEGTDVISGGAGNDTINGNGGDDLLFGDEDNDLINGGAGDDVLSGDDGDDTLDGGAGDDVLYGFDGNDLLTDTQGANEFDGGWGDDTIISGNDDPTLEPVNAYISGGDGADSITAKNFESAMISGDNDNDRIDVFVSDALVEMGIESGWGDDTITGSVRGFQTDTIPGGLDTPIGFLYLGHAQVLAGQGDDNIDLHIDTFYTQIDGEEGDDDIIFSTSMAYAAEVSGGDGSDDIDITAVGDIPLAYSLPVTGPLPFATGGDLFVTGDLGDDLINADLHVRGAMIAGGEGNDTITVDFGAEVVEDVYDPSSDAYSDVLSGYAAIFGGAGNDLISFRSEAAYTEVSAGDGDDQIEIDSTSSVVTTLPREMHIFTGDGRDTIRLTSWSETEPSPAVVEDFTAGVGGDLLDLDDLFFSLGWNGVSDPFAAGLVYFVDDGAGNTAIIAEFAGGPLPVLVLARITPDMLTADNISGGYTPALIAVPTEGDDTLTGTVGDDSIDGLGGNDLINGLDGDDTLEGGDGEDTIYGGDGNDTLSGGAGFDTISGEAGDDVIYQALGSGDNDMVSGGDGLDTFIYDASGSTSIDFRHVSGTTTQLSSSEAVSYISWVEAYTITGSDSGDGMSGEGLLTNDTFYGGDGNDTLMGGSEDDYLSGGSGDDTLDGGSDNDLLYGDLGNDLLDGGTGNDTLWGNSGNDWLDGGDGDDQLSGGADADTIYGGTGNDTFLAASGEGADSIWGGDSVVGDGAAYTDVLIYNGSAASAAINFNYVAGSTNTHRLTVDGTTSNYSDIEAFEITGGTYNDFLQGASDHAFSDTFYGGDGNDTLNGRSGDDLLYGEAGDDSLNGGSGADVLFGGAGDDSLDTGFSGYDEGDILDGGDGTDFGRISYLYETADLNINFAAAADAGTITLMGGTVLSSIERVEFTSGSGDDTLQSGGMGDKISAGTGDDMLVYDGSAELTPLNFRYNSSFYYYYFTGDSGLQNQYREFEATNIIGGAANDTILGSKDSAHITSDIFSGGAGNDSLDGGYGDDTLFGGDGNDYMLGDRGDDILYGEAGNDTLIGGDFGSDTLYGGDGNDSLRGFGDDDLIYGETGDDILDGNTGNDTLDGGQGNDSINGGADDDIIIVSTGRDTIDGADGVDVLYGDGTGIAVAMAFSYVSGTQYALTIGADTSTITNVELFNLTAGDGDDTLMGADTLAINDTFQGGLGNDSLGGGAGDDLLFGGEGLDTLLGGSGDDRLSGELGDDSLEGGDGNDTLIGGDGADVLDGGAGTDRVSYMTSATGVAVDLAGTGAGGEAAGDTYANIEIVAGSQHDDTITGSAGNDTLFGIEGDDALSGADGDDVLVGDTGNDTLNGGAGDDTLFGGAGADHFSGGDGTDRVIYADVATAVLVDLAGVGAFGEAEGDTFEGIEIVVGSAGDDTIRGDAAAELLAGGQGNDSLEGRGGNDSLAGEAGNDTLDGGTGSDSLFGGIGDDLLMGADDNDRLFGDAGNDTLDGGAGNDTLFGGDGADAFIGGDGADWVVYNRASAAVEADMAGTGASSGEAAGDTFTGIEIVVGSAFNDTLKGSAGAETLTGGLGDDLLDGREGNDYIMGEAGDDTLMGGAGNDTMLGGAGADHFDGGTGTDRVVYIGAATGVVVDLAGSGLSSGEAAGDTFTSIEIVVGSNLADTLIGGAADESLMGAGGNDRLDGGDGADVLVGGAGADVFVFDMGYGRDRIADFTAADTVEISSALWDATGASDWADFLAGHAQQMGARVDLAFSATDILVINDTTIAALEAAEAQFLII